MRSEGFARQPALDGVRAVAVAVVLVFHLGVSWLPGGYLGVSVFFTLSGFLITSLLLHEHASAGRVEIGAFYVRRIRRLLPGSMLCLAAVAALAIAGVLPEREAFASELHATLLQYANWDALLSGRSYGALFEAPSPIAHFWSLAIEEQFYLVWPLVMAALAGWAARRPERPRAVIALAVLFGVLALSAPLTAVWWSADAAYFASWARFAEIAAGALLAAVVVRRSVPARAGALALPALLAIVVLCVVSPSGRGWAYEGWLPLFSLLSVALIAALQVEGPVRRALSWGPAVWVGKVSYGLYLFHWPLFAILDTERTGLDGPALAGVRLGASVLAAAVSFYLFETPLRIGRIVPRTGRYVALAGTAMVVVAIAATAAPRLERVPASDEVVVLGASISRSSAVPGAAPTAAAGPSAPSAAGAGQAVPGESAAAVEGATPSAPPPPPPAPPRPAVAAVFGDSIPDWLLRDAAASYDRTDVTVVDAAMEGCDGAVAAPRLRGRNGVELFPPDACREWTASYPEVIDGDLPVDVALLVLGQAPLVDRFVGGVWVSPCVDMGWYLDDVRARIRYLGDEVEKIVLVLPAWGGKGATWVLADDHLARAGCVRDQLRSLADELDIPTVDLAELLCPAGPDGACSDLRQRDGTHVDPEDAPAVLDWLLDRSLAADGTPTRSHPQPTQTSENPWPLHSIQPSRALSGPRLPVPG